MPTGVVCGLLVARAPVKLVVDLHLLVVDLHLHDLPHGEARRRLLPAPAEHDD